MTSRKKIAISITAVCVVLLVAVVTIVAVWAAGRAQVGSDFSGSYIAYNVDATITGDYKMGGLTSDEKEAEGYTDLKVGGSEDTITFVATDPTASANKSFDTVSNIIFTSQEQSILFRYFITNTSTEGGADDPAVSFKITGEENYTSQTNLTITYQYKLADGSVETLNLSEGVVVAPSQVCVVYVNIAVTNPDVNATLDGGVTWTLTAVDAAVGA